MANVLNPKLWAVFDTAAHPGRPQYYRDVHNILAYPRGSVLRYNYLEKYFAGDALQRATVEATGANQGPSAVLLVYAQWSQYARRADPPPGDIPASEILFVATRLARLLSITKDAKQFYLDLCLDGYPDDRPQALAAILNPLIAANEVPYRCWIGLSENEAAWYELKGTDNRADDTTHWARVVDQLANPPMQFAGDFFWRVNGLRTANGNHIVEPRTRLIGPAPSQNTAEWYYEIPEHSDHQLLITSHTPRGAGSGAGQATTISIASDRKEDLDPIGPSTLQLRPYDTTTVGLRSHRSELAGPRRVMVTLETIDPAKPPTGWPNGPAISMPVQVRKGTSRVALGLGLLLVVAIGGAALASQKPSLAILLVCTGVLFGLGVLGVLVLTGKVATK